MCISSGLAADYTREEDIVPPLSLRSTGSSVRVDAAVLPPLDAYVLNKPTGEYARVEDLRRFTAYAFFGADKDSLPFEVLNERNETESPPIPPVPENVTESEMFWREHTSYMSLVDDGKRKIVSLEWKRGQLKGIAHRRCDVFVARTAPPPPPPAAPGAQNLYPDDHEMTQLEFTRLSPEEQDELLATSPLYADCDTNFYEYGDDNVTRAHDIAVYDPGRWMRVRVEVNFTQAINLTSFKFIESEVHKAEEMREAEGTPRGRDDTYFYELLTLAHVSVRYDVGGANDGILHGPPATQFFALVNTTIVPGSASLGGVVAGGIVGIPSATLATVELSQKQDLRRDVARTPKPDVAVASPPPPSPPPPPEFGLLQPKSYSELAATTCFDSLYVRTYVRTDRQGLKPPRIEPKLFTTTTEVLIPQEFLRMIGFVRHDFSKLFDRDIPPPTYQSFFGVYEGNIQPSYVSGLPQFWQVRGYAETFAIEGLSRTTPQGCPNPFVSYDWSLVRAPQDSGALTTGSFPNSAADVATMPLDNVNPLAYAFTQDILSSDQAGLGVVTRDLPTASMRPDRPGQYAYKLEVTGPCAHQKQVSIVNVTVNCNARPTASIQNEIVWLDIDDAKQMLDFDVKSRNTLAGSDENSESQDQSQKAAWCLPAIRFISSTQDADGDKIYFQWALTRRPTGPIPGAVKVPSLADDGTYSSTQVLATAEGDYRTTLYVTDGCKGNALTESASRPLMAISERSILYDSRCVTSHGMNRDESLQTASLIVVSLWILVMVVLARRNLLSSGIRQVGLDLEAARLYGELRRSCALSLVEIKQQWLLDSAGTTSRSRWIKLILNPREVLRKPRDFLPLHSYLQYEAWRFFLHNRRYYDLCKRAALATALTVCDMFALLRSTLYTIRVQHSTSGANPICTSPGASGALDVFLPGYIFGGGFACTTGVGYNAMVFGLLLLVMILCVCPTTIALCRYLIGRNVSIQSECQEVCFKLAPNPNCPRVVFAW